MFQGLPEIAYAYDISDSAKPLEEQKVLKIKRGEKGYYHTNLFGGKPEAQRLNEAIGVTAAQAKAMLNGSMFGWDVPAANPALYEQDTTDW